ncbi:hypothetical protein EX30DRAFT_394457 [Ascodesmis nigricans]|uniref:PXA domain-containing protein n=1 Tax=Ascodesmis nigricans TaxID=341454 RepID=A0A4S2N245_9PEZI|nr:hypothetical protein EX30DRAFT_394457 [Ascodesmis nigricans]
MSTPDTPSTSAPTPTSSHPSFSLPPSPGPAPIPSTNPESSCSSPVPGDPRPIEPPDSNNSKSASNNEEHSTSAAELVQRVLDFLSTATPGTLAAVSVGGVAVLYVVLGKLGLLVIGVVAGAVGHAALELTRPQKADGIRDLLVKVGERIKYDDKESGAVGVNLTGQVDFSRLPPETAKVMEELTDAAVKDYVRFWYTNVLPEDNNFPASCRTYLANTLLTMYTHLSHKRAADTFLLILISTSNTLIVLLRELAAASQSSIATYLEEFPSSALAQMLDTSVQKKRLRLAAEDIVQRFFGKEVQQCEPVRTFFVEVLSGVALKMTVEKMAEPDWINGMIVWMLDEETQPEILQKIDLGEATEAAKEQVEKVDPLPPAPTEPQETQEQREVRIAMEKAEKMNQLLAEEEAARQKHMSMPVEPRSSRSSSTTDKRNTFTSFDQIVPQRESEPIHSVLHGAHIMVSDLSAYSGSDRPLRSKPTIATYLLQIEPASSLTSGWLVTRKYSDFESLHEVLRRISAVSGLSRFTSSHAELPTWRNETPDTLRAGLEQYLNNALDEKELADCEGMKRFLDKDNGIDAGRGSGAFAGLGKGVWPVNPQAFAKMGQGALDALAKAPQGVAEGGKGLFGGMKKAFTATGASMRDDGSANGGMKSLFSASGASMVREEGGNSSGIRNPFAANGASMRAEAAAVRSRSSTSLSSLNQPSISDTPTRTTHSVSITREPSFSLDRIAELEDRRNRSDIGDPFSDNRHVPSLSRQTSAASSQKRTTGVDTIPQVDTVDGDHITLPPPPSDMPDDFLIDDTTPSRRSTTSSPPPPSKPSPIVKPPTTKLPLTTDETAFIIEIVFALISELYTLSSAWTLRRSLLNVAKSLLLRPGNQALDDMRALIQETVVDGNTTDYAVAGMLRRLREGVFPTEEEVGVWREEERERERRRTEEGGEMVDVELREKARRLLVEKGVPQALKGVMGTVATEEALGVVFEALQMKSVARGVVGGLVVEGCRGLCS